MCRPGRPLTGRGDLDDSGISDFPRSQSTRQDPVADYSGRVMTPGGHSPGCASARRRSVNAPIMVTSLTCWQSASATRIVGMDAREALDVRVHTRRDVIMETSNLTLSARRYDRRQIIRGLGIGMAGLTLAGGANLIQKDVVAGQTPEDAHPSTFRLTSKTAVRSSKSSRCTSRRSCSQLFRRSRWTRRLSCGSRR
jgi:hypothetical protein